MQMKQVAEPERITLSLPKLDAVPKDSIAVVKCVGKHHKELLHEICDLNPLACIPWTSAF